MAEDIPFRFWEETQLGSLFRAGTILSGRREKIIFGKKEFRKSRGR
jgi:hypothetical protein